MLQKDSDGDYDGDEGCGPMADNPSPAPRTGAAEDVKRVKHTTDEHDAKARDAADRHARHVAKHGKGQ